MVKPKLAEFFPRAGGSSSSDNADDADNLDNQLENLRVILQKKKEIAELQKQISELGVEDNASSVSENRRSPLFNFKDVENSMHKFSGDDNLSINKWLQLFEETADLLQWSDLMRYVYTVQQTVNVWYSEVVFTNSC